MHTRMRDLRPFRTAVCEAVRPGMPERLLVPDPTLSRYMWGISLNRSRTKLTKQQP